VNEFLFQLLLSRFWALAKRFDDEDYVRKVGLKVKGIVWKTSY